MKYSIFDDEVAEVIFHFVSENFDDYMNYCSEHLNDNEMISYALFCFERFQEYAFNNYFMDVVLVT